jgi:hypothetical protein
MRFDCFVVVFWALLIFFFPLSCLDAGKSVINFMKLVKLLIESAFKGTDVINWGLQMVITFI